VPVSANGVNVKKALFRWTAEAFWAVLLGLTAVFLVSTSALAHITLEPSESDAGAFVEYVVRVPCERSVPTVKVRLEFPSGLVVSRFLPQDGWRREVETDSSGRVIAVSWYGGRIFPDEFQKFAFLARNPSSPGKMVWKAFQTYEDGTVVEWVEPEGSQRPAPVTLLRSSKLPTPNAGVENREPTGPVPGSAGISTAEPRPVPTTVPGPPPREMSAGSSVMPLVLGTGALSLLALIVGLVALARSFGSPRT
jgi:uncharacterized protein YcnI